ncbi:MAG: hypothetical protein AAGA18_02625 [Verrucomicrobiota bacterium]
MKIDHQALTKSLRLGYSAERAAAFAYVGHAGSLKDLQEIKAVRQIEQDEWNHRKALLEIMDEYEIPVSKYFEIKYYLIGTLIGLSCYIIGRFMPYFFAGRLESGNVCEYFVMMKYFNTLGIHKHDQLLYEMGVKEKEHEDYFLDLTRNEKWLPLFERFFSWGISHSRNDVDLEDVLPIN